MIESGFINVAISIMIFTGILINARIRKLKDTALIAPEILIAVYSMASGVIIIFYASAPYFEETFHAITVILLYLPFACVLAANQGHFAHLKKNPTKWLISAIIMTIIYATLDRGDYNFGYDSFISDIVITIFFGFGLLRIRGIQRIMLLLAVIIWSAFHLSTFIAFQASLCFTLGALAYVRVTFMNNSSVFNRFEFFAEDLVESSVIPFLILDLSGRIVYANREFIDFSGYDNSEINNKEAIELFEIPNNWMLKIDPYGGYKRVRCTLLAKDGRKLPILLWLNEIRGNGKDLKNLICYIYDESEHQVMKDKIIAGARRFSGLHETSRALTSSLEMRDVLETIAGAAESLTDSETCTVFMLDHNKQMINAIFSTEEIYSDEVMNFEFSVGQGLTGRVVGEGRPLIQNYNDENDLAVLIPGTSDDEESILSAPLLAKNVVIGALTLYKTGKKIFDDENLETLTVFASQAASAIETSRLYMKLKESEKVYRSSVDLAGDGIMFVDSETGKITDANEMIKNLLDYSRAEIVAKYIWELHPQPQMQIARQLWQSVRGNGNDILSEIEYESKDGKIIAASINASIIAAGDVKFIQWVVRDMSEYKRTIDRMAFFYDVFDALEEPVLITEANGAIFFSNISFKSFLHIDSDLGDCTGNSKVSLRSLNMPDLDEIWEKVSGKARYTKQVVLKIGREDRVTKNVHVFAKYDKNTTLTHYIWMFRPVAENEVRGQNRHPADIMR
ncbi:MAG: PAS domain S-box protein [candidate division Zixibacteria bacterium]